MSWSLFLQAITDCRGELKRFFLIVIKRPAERLPCSLILRDQKLHNGLKIYSESGIEGLMGKPHKGSQSRLTDLQKILLCDIVDSGPVAYGLESGIWTSKLIGQIIEHEFNVSTTPIMFGRFLKKWVFLFKSPNVS